MLNQALTLLEASNFNEARSALATVNSQDANYPTTRGLDALCLYQLDKRKFIDLMHKPEMVSMAFPAELSEELDFDQIDTLFFYRNFEEIMPKIREFGNRYSNSPKHAAVAEYQMASLYERGMKKVYEACAYGDTNVFQTRYWDGRSNLVDYLNLVSSLNQANYHFLPTRSLKEEIRKAKIALGSDNDVEAQISGADGERMAFLSVQLHQKLQPGDEDDNLRRMTNFLSNFPDTKYRQRVSFDMAGVALNRGVDIIVEAEHERDPLIAAEKRAAAVSYFDRTRGLYSAVQENKEAGISEADVQNSREGILRAYYMQDDWAGLSNWANHMVTNSTVGEKEWLAAKLYDAAGLIHQKRMAEAANELDEILATGFKGNPSYDGLLASAASWRINVARLTHDEVSAWRVAQQVQNSDCYDSIKRTFVKRFQQYLPQSAPISQ